jgi:hypothetical protein
LVSGVHSNKQTRDLESGVIRRLSIELLLNKIESIAVNQGLLGRALDYGTVVVRGTGGTAEPFTEVRYALEFRRQVQTQIEHYQTMIGAGGAERGIV